MFIYISYVHVYNLLYVFENSLSVMVYINLNFKYSFFLGIFFLFFVYLTWLRVIREETSIETMPPPDQFVGEPEVYLFPWFIIDVAGPSQL